MAGLLARLSKWVQFSKKFVPHQARLWRWGQHFLGVNSAFFFYCISPVSAAETVVLQYADRQVTVSLTELKTFVETGEPSPILQEFIERVPSDQVFERQLFSSNLPLRFEPSGEPNISRNAQFILYQINKLVGKPSGEENYPALRTALIEASGGRGLTLIGLIEAYPEASVRVELRDLERVYSDINLFIERIQPLVQSRQLIEDWLCDCVPVDDSPTVEATTQTISRCGVARFAEGGAALNHGLHRTSDSTLINQKTLNSTVSNSPVLSSTTFLELANLSNSSSSEASSSEASELQANLQTVTPLLLALDWLSQTPAAVSTPPTAPKTLAAASVAASNQPSNRRLVFTLGPLGRSIAIDDLARFAETGETTRQIRSYLRLANVDAETVRALLNRKVKVELQLVDRLLNNVLGEYVLFQASAVIHTRSRRADILAMRSAIILSLHDDNQISPIEFLQRYPTQQVYIDGIALLEVARFVRRTQQNVGEVTNEIGDWLVGVRSAIAEDICRCNRTTPVPTPSEVAPSG
ncbi:MAG: alpha/beta hydrolase [Cyanobacteria bacterium RM1_2_2]|nr:alpha/beta hydrolase [Cyanobacteria bacterium RM1_2_2]